MAGKAFFIRVRSLWLSPDLLNQALARTYSYDLHEYHNSGPKCFLRWGEYIKLHIYPYELTAYLYLWI